jgi:hypothetical protein
MKKTQNIPEEAIITGASFPVAAAMRDFYEAATRLVEQGVGFWPALDRTRLASIRTVADQVSG